VPVDQHREGDHADDKDEDRKQETDRIADKDQFQTLLRGEHGAQELARRSRIGRAEYAGIDEFRALDPEIENSEQNQPESGDRPERPRADDRKGLPPGRIKAEFAAPAQLVK